MKNLFYIAIIAMFFTSCGEDDPIIYGTETLTDVATENEFILIDNSTSSFTFDGSLLSGVQALEIPVGIVAAPKSSAVSYTYEIVEPTTAVQGTHLIVDGSSGSIPAGSLKAFLPLSVDMDQMDPGTEYSVSVQLVSSDITVKKSVATYTFAKICPSNLAGFYTASSTVKGIAAGIGWDACDGSTWSGSLEIREIDVASYSIHTIKEDGGEYWNDPSFGAYYACYDSGSEANLANGVDGAAGSVIIGDICGKLGFSGLSQWNESYIFTEVTVTGNNLSLGWSNDYGEAGNVVITSENGWPEGLSF